MDVENQANGGWMRKPVNRSCSLGKRGEATYEDMFAATQNLRQKMDLVHALADAG